MAKANIPFLAFNRGIVSKLALARTDIPRIGMSAAIQDNWLPVSLGSMSPRPGLGYISGTRNNLKAVHIDFIRALDDTAILELTDSTMRVRINDVVVTRPAVTTAIINGTFDTGLSGWTNADEPGAVSDWSVGGYMILTGTRLNAAIQKQAVTVPGGSIGVEHGLRLVVTRGTVRLRVGSADGADDLIRETQLDAGTHSLAFTPGATFYIQISNSKSYSSLITSVTLDSAGDLTIPAPWVEADLKYVRWSQSVDVIYCACRGYQQRKIERRGLRSWSIVRYAPLDGPFRIINTTSTTITPSGFTGDITLTSSRDLFYSGHNGALWRIGSVGQNLQNSIAGDDQYSASIRITGVKGTRRFSYSIAGTWTGEVTLQRSVDDGSSWDDVTTYTSNIPGTGYNDGFDNQIYLYRLGFKPGEYVSGSADVTLYSASGSVTGIVRIIGAFDSRNALATVIQQLGGISPTTDWYEGEWSDHRGWPTAVSFFEDRLCWHGNDRNILSITDSYESFDDSVEGDSGVINRSIGGGPVANINSALSLQRLILLADTAEYVASSSSLDDVLSPTAYNIKAPSSQGSARVAAVKVDNGGFFVQASGSRVFSINYDGVSLQYSSEDISKIAPEIFEAGIVKIAVQRQPDTRIHCLLADGTVVLLIHDPLENLRCLVTQSTPGAAGFVEDIIVMPGTLESRVYYCVRRTVNGNTIRCLERFAMASECRAGLLHKQVDSHIAYTGAPTATVSAPHLAMQQVVIWADGAALLDEANEVKLFTLNGVGQVALDTMVTNYVVGLPYTATYKSTKLAYAAQAGTALTQTKRLTHLGLIFSNTHGKGIYYGKSFTTMDTLPRNVNGAPVAVNHIWEDLDLNATSFMGGWDTDCRLHLKSNSLLPCTILAAVVGIDVHEKV